MQDDNEGRGRVFLPSVGASAEEAVATAPQFLRFWKMTLLATMSMDTSSSPVK